MSKYLKRGILCLLLGVGSVSGFAQSSLNVFPSAQTTLPDHHTDVFDLIVKPSDVGRPIESMTLFLDVLPMNQINPNGESTVFRTDSLSPAVVGNDSHFLLDPSQFTVVMQSESTAIMSATVNFGGDVVFARSGRLDLVQAAAPEGHASSEGPGAFGTFRVDVAFADGGAGLGGGDTIIPEPSTYALLGIGICAIGICRRRRA